MSEKLYKYIGFGYRDKVFASKESATLRCSYPRDFDDPYELFLTIDFNERPEVLAFYTDVIGAIPQLPTTCFSRSPSVIPMWAHYAQNLQGFVIEFDEAKLVACFPESSFGDVDYLDEPNASISDILFYAYEIGKYRYVYSLLKSVSGAAYFTKHTCWSYELERRMIVNEEETKQLNSLILMEVPNDCITAIICGPRASIETVKALRGRAESIGCDYFEIKIGRTASIPFFLDFKGDPYIFQGEHLIPSPASCGTCKEPLKSNADHCSWCLINKSHQESAAARNPFRLLANLGLLDSYIEGMEDVSRGYTKK